MWASRCLIALGLVWLLSPVSRLDAEETVYPLERISIADSESLPAASRHLCFGGQAAPCTNTKRPEIKAYPKPQSQRPLYGAVKFNSSYYDSSEAVEYQFMVDQSDKQAKPDKVASLFRDIADVVGGQMRQERLADEYDLFYFDVNHDLDLTNDPAVVIMKDPPEMLGSMGGRQTFERIRLPADFDSGSKDQMMELVPSLYPQGPGQAMIIFTPAVAYRGPIRLGGRAYTAILSQVGNVTGRFDRRFTNLWLLEEGKPLGRYSPYGMSWLCNAREVEGKLYDISATPTGEKLIVRTYDGPYGNLRLGSAGKEEAGAGLSGILLSKERILTLGDVSGVPQETRSKEHRVPVGDYAALQLSFDCGKTQFLLRPSPYLPGTLEARTEARPIYAIRIREDQPYVFSFAEKPQIQFLRSGKEQAVRPGHNADIRAILVLPSLGLMISGLVDKTQKIGEYNYRSETGEMVLAPRYRALQPKVVVEDASGKTVAQGDMPFG